MAPRLRVLAGTSPETMVPITSLVNTGTSHTLSSPLFEGKIATYVKGMTDEKGQVRDSEYFSREDKTGITWSIQVQGRFLVPQSADDVLFGNTFDRPLKLPWGTSAVLKFMHYIDPTLEHDLTSSTKPWALSPLIATMPNFIHTRLESNSFDEVATDIPAFPPSHSIVDDTKELHYALVNIDSDGLPMSSPSSSESLLVPPSHHTNALNRPPSALSVGSSGSATSYVSTGSSGSSGSTRSSTSKNSGTGSLRIKQAMRKVHLRKKSTSCDRRSDECEDYENSELKNARRARLEHEKELARIDSTNASQRRSHFASKAKRTDVWFGPRDLLTTDFCYGFINFAPSLALQLPGGLSFDLMKYWDKQPVRFVCCERVKEGKKQEETPWGRIFWCVAIEVVDSGENGA